MPFELFKQIFIITFHFLRLKIFVDKSNLFSREFFSIHMMTTLYNFLPFFIFPISVYEYCYNANS